MNLPQAKIHNILLVEDTPSYQDLMEIAFEENFLDHHLHMASDVEEALNFIYQRREHQEAPRPDLILLDLNLPKIDGYEFLKIIKQELKFKTIPVIILTSSHQQQDILKSYNLKANCYLSKPYNLQDLIKLVKISINFWLNFSQLSPI